MQKKIELLEEYIKYLIKVIESESIIRDISLGARQKYEQQLASLPKEQSEREEEYKICPQCNKKTGKTYLLSRLPTICQNCDHAWLIG